MQNLRFAIRTLLKNPGLTAAAVLTLALGVGANTAIFSVTNALLWRPLPYREADRLMIVQRADQKGGAAPWSYPKFEVLRDNNQVFEAVAAFSDQSFPLTETDNPERIEVEMVSAGYFPLLGVEAFSGRVFLPEEDTSPNTHAVALIGYGLWQRRFGSDTEAIGQTISINKVQLTIIGILPEGFGGQSGTAQVWTPMMMAPALTFPRRLKAPFAHWHEVIAKLKPGVTIDQAQTEMETLGQKIEQAIPWPASFGPASAERVRAVSLREARIDPALRKSFLIFFAAVALVLMIACANIANLLMARGVSRRKEIAVRSALGASRSRIVRQLLAESLLLALIGSIAGLVVAFWGIKFLTAFKVSAGEIAASKFATAGLDFSAASIDSRVLTFNLLTAVLTALLFGLVPALQASRTDLSYALKQDAPLSTEKIFRLRRLSARSLFVVAEIALSLVLLVGAGLMIKSFARLQAVPTGFDADNVMTLQVDLPKYTEAQATAFDEQLIERISGLAGVESASVASSLPLARNFATTSLKIKDRASPGEETESSIGAHSIGPDYFKALRIPLLRGRAFTNEDRAGRKRVAIINETAARRYWPDEDPIGKEIHLGIGWEKDEFAEIVGIAADVRYRKVEEAVSPDVYLPYLQPTEPASFVIVRTVSDPAAMAGVLREQVREIDRNVAVYDIRTMEERSADATSKSRFGALLLGIFAAMAVALSAVGIYGVMSFAVSSRAREIGIRMALGAGRREVMKLILSDGLILAAAGIALGLIGARATSNALASQLYGVTATDAATFIFVPLILAAVALIAVCLPARRAAKVDPMIALRSE
ncbi:MAG: ABC transporter permease [Acidobacteriota bacterium]